MSELKLKIYVDRLDKVLFDNNISVCHGIKHAIQVMTHAEMALNAKEYNIDDSTKDAVLLAALLHDADDGKFFPDNHNNENLRNILHDKPIEFVDHVARMVNLVSSSKNADNIPDDVKDKEWMLIPRYADRLEALGMIGVERCYIYNKSRGAALFMEDTPKVTSEEEMWKIANIERYNAYKGNSRSMMDHYYDKLIRLGLYPIRNPYFDGECKKRNQPIIDFILKYGRGEINNENDIINYILNDSVMLKNMNI
jgi:uncharacterized protein